MKTSRKIIFFGLPIALLIVSMILAGTGNTVGALIYLTLYVIVVVARFYEYYYR